MDGPSLFSGLQRRPDKDPPCAGDIAGEERQVPVALFEGLPVPGVDLGDLGDSVGVGHTVQVLPGDPAAGGKLPQPAEVGAVVVPGHHQLPRLKGQVVGVAAGATASRSWV